MDTWVHIRGDDDDVGAYGVFALPQGRSRLLQFFLERAHVASSIHIHPCPTAASCTPLLFPFFTEKRETSWNRGWFRSSGFGARSFSEFKKESLRPKHEISEKNITQIVISPIFLKAM